MRVLLDECLPRKLKRTLTGHEVFTVPEMAWASIKNGELLSLMEPLFDVFITIDGNLRYQQNMQNRSIGFVVLTAVDNTIETLQTLMPDVLSALSALQLGDIVRFGTNQSTQEETVDERGIAK